MIDWEEVGEELVDAVNNFRKGIDKLDSKIVDVTSEMTLEILKSILRQKEIGSPA